MLRDYYQAVLAEIVRQSNLSVSRAEPVVSATAGWEEAVRHTFWYLVLADTRPHYRYKRYKELMDKFPQRRRRVVHVDLGCGAGLFSWVFLDWAKGHGMDMTRLSLFGLDHCLAMVQLAQECRKRFLRYLPDYPPLSYHRDIDALCEKLEEDYRDGTDYIVTFGYVLVQVNAQSPRVIRDFTRALSDIMILMKPDSNCDLIAADADGRRPEFAKAWADLLSNLREEGIVSKEIPVYSTPINDSGRAKIARLIVAS